MVYRASKISALMAFAAMLLLSAGTAFAAPSVSPLYPANGSVAYTSHPTFTFQVDGISSPVYCVVFAYNSLSSGQSYNIHYMQAVAYDGVSPTVSVQSNTAFPIGTGYKWGVQCNNTVWNYSRNYFNVVLPTSPPAVSVTTPANFGVSSPITLTWTATTPSPLINCTVYMNNLSPSSKLGDSIIHAPGAFSYTLPAPLADGTYLPYVYCKDTEGIFAPLYTVRAKYLKVDTAAPTASFEGVPESWVSAPVTVYATCIDANCMQWADYFGELAEPEPYPELLAMYYPPFKTLAYSSDPGSCSTDVSLYTGNASPTISSHAWLCAYVVDNMGNAAFSAAPVEIKVDTGAPSVVISGPGTAPAQSKSIFATPMDDSSVATLDMSVTGGSVCVSSLAFVPYAPLAFTSEDDNGKSVCYKAVDGVGNTAYVLSDPILGIDTTAPAITVPSGITAAATGADGASVDYIAGAEDSVSGKLVASCAPGSGSLFAVGTTAVACSATDEAGNTATATFDVTVTPLPAADPVAINDIGVKNIGVKTKPKVNATDVAVGANDLGVKPADALVAADNIATADESAVDATGVDVAVVDNAAATDAAVADDAAVDAVDGVVVATIGGAAKVDDATDASVAAVDDAPKDVATDAAVKATGTKVDETACPAAVAVKAIGIRGIGTASFNLPVKCKLAPGKEAVAPAQSAKKPAKASVAPVQ
ncbi:MAG: HYR domain-containing protein [Candidatus Micrarchaeia archaeon]